LSIQSALGRPTHELRATIALRTARVVFRAIGVLLAIGALLAPQSSYAQQTSPEFNIDDVPVPAALPSGLFGAGSYEENCAPCHGVEGMGDGPTASQLPGPPTAFADPDAVWDQSPAQLFHTTKFGRMAAMMPPWQNELSDAMIWNTLAYAWSLHTSEQETVQGQETYEVSCANCHGDTGAGDGPDATQPLQDLSDPAYAMAMSQADWTAGWQEAHPEIGEEWTDSERRQVLEYVRTFSMVPPWQATAEGNGVIRGTVVQGTPGGTEAGGAVVTLESFVDFQPLAVYSTTVGVDGAFEFTGLAVDPDTTNPSMVYLASVTQDGVRYSSPITTLTTEQPEAEADVTVFGVTDDPSSLVLDRVHWIIDSQPGALVVLQVLEVGNTGDRTFVGETVSDVDEPVTVAFHVPADAVEISFENGALGERFIQVGDLIYDTTPVVPGSGTRQIIMQYALPFDGDSVSLEQTFEYPVSTVNLLVADMPGLEVDIPGLDPAGTRDFNGSPFRVWSAADLGLEPIVINLTGLLRSGDVDPRAVQGATSTSSPTAPYEPWMAWLIALLAVVSLGGVLTWSWKNGRFDSSDTPESLGAQRQELLRSIARLDDLHALGEIGDSTWQAQRAQLKNRLLEIDGQLAQGGRSRH